MVTIIPLAMPVPNKRRSLPVETCAGQMVRWPLTLSQGIGERNHGRIRHWITLVAITTRAAHPGGPPRSVREPFYAAGTTDSPPTAWFTRAVTLSLPAGRQAERRVWRGGLPPPQILRCAQNDNSEGLRMTLRLGTLPCRRLAPTLPERRTRRRPPGWTAAAWSQPPCSPRRPRRTSAPPPAGPGRPACSPPAGSWRRAS